MDTSLALFRRGDKRRKVAIRLRIWIGSGRKPAHDARWGKATLEVALAIQQSARERREITLAHQVAVPPGS